MTLPKDGYPEWLERKTVDNDVAELVTSLGPAEQDSAYGVEKWETALEEKRDDGDRGDEKCDDIAELDVATSSL